MIFQASVTTTTGNVSARPGSEEKIAQSLVRLPPELVTGRSMLMPFLRSSLRLACRRARAVPTSGR